MKNNIFKYMLRTFAVVFGVMTLMTGCKKEFLNADPLSFYEPAKTFQSEDGIKSVLAIADRQLKRYWTEGDSNEMLPLISEYTFSDMMVPSATDKNDLLDNVAQKLTPNSDQSTLVHLDRVSTLWFFWNQTFEGLRNANTILTYIDNIPIDESKGFTEAKRNMYKGMAYFHRAFRYYLLVFQYNNVPLMTKVLQVPKLNFKSTSREAILQMLVEDMENAVQWVPEQSEMDFYGYVNKGACKMLLSKLYLATGEYGKAKTLLDGVIASYKLMEEPFGTFTNNYENSATWPITRNVIWDLHRPENVLAASNTETIMGMPNRGAAAESFLKDLTMRIMYPFFFNNQITMPDGKQALLNTKRNDAKYKETEDYMRALGRGISTVRPTPYYQYNIWYVNGVLDEGDLRHSTKHGNWVTMESLKCNNPASEYYGQNLQLYDGDKLLCADTIRRWYAFPHYIFKKADPVNDANISGSDGLRGATDGGMDDMYLYRVAEAYLLRAEAQFYLGKGAEAAADVNVVRKRAGCTQMYGNDITIGDIMDERARELFWEEFRNVELKRVSLCLARSGKPDEWGNTYDLKTFDKQDGTDRNGGSYWYQRCIHSGLYNTGITININASKSQLNYIIDKHNMYWPIPEKEIKANNKGKLWQNFGYTGYDESIPVWTDWKEAVADQDVTE